MKTQTAKEIADHQDLVSLQNEQLKQGKVQFLHSLQPEIDKIYGHKNKPRDDEPSMKQLMSWGYEAAVKDDFIKDDTQIRYKIKKMNKEYVSEVHDNFRKPEMSPSKGVYLFNYLEEEDQERWKKKIFDMVVEEETDPLKKSSYKQQFCGEDRKDLEKFLNTVTPAGKTSYEQKENQTLVRPQDYLKQKMEEKLKTMVWKQIDYEPHLEQHRQSTGHQQTDGNEITHQPVTFNEQNIEKKELSRKKSLKKRAQSAKQKDKQLDKRVNEIKSTSRWLPDSALTTYFGKPAFHPYGNGNTNPTVGGSVYGQYLLSHNVNPQSGDNKPEYKQVFGRAILGAHQPVVKGPGLKKSATKKERVPHLPKKVREDIRLSPSEVEDLKSRNPIMPPPYSQTQEHVNIVKPDLAKEKYLQSNHTTPAESHNQSFIENQPPKQQPQPKITFARSGNVSKNNSHPVSATQQKNTVEQPIVKKSTVPFQNQTNQVTIHQDKQYTPTKYQKVSQLESIQEGDDQHIDNKQGTQKNIVSPDKVPQENLLEQAATQLYGQQTIPFCPIHATTQQNEFLHLLDPKNYKYLPHQYTQAIRPAGRFSHKSEAVSNLFQMV